MKEKLTNNWGLKLIAVLAAVVIWLVIMNTTDPVTTFTVTGIPIEFLNEESAITDNDMVYEVVGAKTVSVTVTTRTVDKDKIKKDDFKATVDLAEIYGVTGKVGINVQVVGEDAALVRSWEPLSYSVQIDTEKIIEKTFEIEVMQEGEVEDGYVYRQCTLSSDTVTLRAPESQIAKVASVKAIVDVSQSLDDEQVAVELTYYNAAGNKLNIESMDITTDRKAVDAHIVVQKTSPVSLDVVVQNKDGVAEGYRYITYRISTQSISVIGSKQSVAGLDKIQIEMDAIGAEGNVVKQIDLNDYLPDNVSVAGDNTLVTVTLVIEPEGTLELNVPVESITVLNKNEEMNYTISVTEVPVEVFGLVSDWEDISAEDIRLSVDVDGLEEGEHELTVEAVEVDGLQITVTEPIMVTVELIESPTEEPTEEGSGEAGTDEDSDQVSGTVSGTESEGETDGESEEEESSTEGAASRTE